MYCSKCGNSLAEGAAFCMNCGSSSAPVMALAPGSPVRPAAGGSVAGLARVSYAGFWLRWVAHLLDFVVLGVLFVGSLLAFILLTGIGAALSDIHDRSDFSDVIGLLGFGAIVGYGLLVFCGVWLYFAFSESSDWQATPGKKMLGLRVTDLGGQPISFLRATGRYFGKFITTIIPLMIGYIMAGFTEKKQALHDMIAGCLVLRND